MLLCDSCNRGYHTYCLKPALRSIPAGDWFCPMCTLSLDIPSLPRVIDMRDHSISTYPTRSGTQRNDVQADTSELANQFDDETTGHNNNTTRVMHLDSDDDVALPPLDDDDTGHNNTTRVTHLDSDDDVAVPVLSQDAPPPLDDYSTGHRKKRVTRLDSDDEDAHDENDAHVTNRGASWRAVPNRLAMTPTDPRARFQKRQHNNDRCASCSFRYSFSCIR